MKNDVFYNRPTSEESVNINNLKTAFFTGKGTPFPVLEYDDLLTEADFESK